MNNWPKAEEVAAEATGMAMEADWDDAVKYLQQFAHLLRQMEATGSPETEAALDGCTDSIVAQSRLIPADVFAKVRDLCRHFEKLSGAARQIERQAVVEECARIAETASDLLQNSTFEGVAAAIRALSAQPASYTPPNWNALDPAPRVVIVGGGGGGDGAPVRDIKVTNGKGSGGGGGGFAQGGAGVVQYGKGGGGPTKEAAQAGSEVTERVSDDVLAICAKYPDYYDDGKRSMARELIELRAAVGVEPIAWRPIESAPDNHFPILVSGPYGQLVAFRDVTWAWWPVPANEALDYKPTHWMPLPQKPTKDGGMG